jgi:hypothetical protein
MGFVRAVVPRPVGGVTLASIEGLDVLTAETLADAIKLALSEGIVSPHGEAVPAMLG